MKNKLLLLLKNNFKNMYHNDGKKGKKIGFAVLFLYVICCLFLAFGYVINNLYVMLNDVSLQAYFVPMCFAMDMIFTFVLSVFMTKPWLFDSKDNEQLLALPIKKRTILASRLLGVVIYNFAVSLVVVIPMVAVLIVNNALSLYMLLNVVVIIIFNPIIPTILASLFGYLTATLMSKSKFKTIIELAMNFLFVILYLVVYFSLNSLLANLVNNPVLLNNILKYGFYPIYLIYMGFVVNDSIYILYFVFINIALVIGFLFVFKKSYYRILSGLKSYKVKGNYKVHDLKQDSVQKALFKKEFKRYFGNSTYIFNTVFGMAFLLLGAIISFFTDKESVVGFINVGSSISSFTLITMMIIFMVFMTNTTNVCISLERDNFWILKSLPVRTVSIFLSKILINVMVVIFPVTFSLVLFVLSGYISWVEFPMLLFLTVCINAMCSTFGLIVNLKFPALNSESDVAIIKRSFSSFIGVFVPTIISMIVIGILLYTDNTIVIIFSISFICLLLSVLFVFILRGWGVKRFKEIN